MERLISVFGLAVFVGLSYAFSVDPRCQVAARIVGNCFTANFCYFDSQNCSWFRCI